MRCARDECDNTELTTKTATLRARSRVHVVLRVDSLDLGFHVVIGVGRLNVQQDGFIRQLHFTTQTQHQVQSSFLLDVVVRLCPVIVHSICIPNSCKFLIAKTGFLRCCIYRKHAAAPDMGLAHAQREKRVTSRCSPMFRTSSAQPTRCRG